MFRFVFRALREEEGREGIIRAKNAFADLPPEAALAFARFVLSCCVLQPLIRAIF